MPEWVEARVERLESGKREEVTDRVIAEYPLTIFVNRRELVTLLCTPQYLEALAVGYLHAEGFLENREAIAGMRLDDSRGVVEVTLGKEWKPAEALFARRTITTGCGRGTVFYNATDPLTTRPVQSGMRVAAGEVSRLATLVQKEVPLFRATGGAHCAVLAGDGFFLLREDIGRHNAVDKVAGECLLQGWDTGDKILFTTGRVSSEMLLKAARLGVPVVASRSAPTDLAVRLADELRIALVGFARGSRLNVYAHGWRIL